MHTNFKDEFDAPLLVRQWLHPLPKASFSATLENSTLILRDEEGNGNRNEKGSPAGTMLGIVPESADFTVETTVNNQNEALKGLTLYVTAQNSLRSEEHTSELQSLMRISYA